MFHEAAIPDHISGEDSGELSFHVERLLS